MKKPTYCYLAGALTHDKRNVFNYVRKAGKKYVKLAKAGFVPYSPHFAILADISCGGLDYEDWLLLDFRWIDRCDALVRIEGPSSGADREVEYAKSKNIPTYTWKEFCKKFML